MKRATVVPASPSTTVTSSTIKRVVVLDRADRLAVRERRVDGAAEVDEERLVGLGGDIAGDRRC